jgi:hypothetical protein
MMPMAGTTLLETMPCIRRRKKPGGNVMTDMALEVC